jgi:hypothetical protein
MEIAPVTLILADISGYTRFVKMHHISLLHAEQIITELMEAITARSKNPWCSTSWKGMPLSSMPAPGIVPTWPK